MSTTNGATPAPGVPETALDALHRPQQARRYTTRYEHTKAARKAVQAADWLAAGGEKQGGAQ